MLMTILGDSGNMTLMLFKCGATMVYHEYRVIKTMHKRRIMRANYPDVRLNINGEYAA